LIGVRVKIERTASEPIVWVDLPRFGRKLIVWAAFLSLLIHTLSFFTSKTPEWVGQRPENTSVKIHMVPPKDLKFEQDDTMNKRTIETPMAETAPPQEANYAGAQDHRASKPQKMARKLLPRDAQLDPGMKGRAEAKDHVRKKEVPNTLALPRHGTLSISGARPQTAYEKLLPSKESDVFGTPNGGYADYIDADIPEGDRLDLDTTNFRFISYFTGLRKAIELVWIYPREAMERGLQGVVYLQMVIEKDGRVSRVRVSKSSGFSVLDDNMIQTIKQAAPFAPLPKGWKKERVLVSGAFSYVLLGH
jgi:periplasmic protein TonB